MANPEKHECPFFKDDIDDSECYLMAMAAERLSPQSELPEELQNNPDFEKKCLECKYHCYD